jgi:spore coat protein U-like protein
MKKLLLPTALLLTTGLTAVGVAYAATATTPLDVTVTITSACSVTTAGVNFGTVDGTAPTPGAGSVDVTCSSTTPYTIALDSGNNFNTTTRRVSDGSTQFIAYDLMDSTTLWGDAGMVGATNTWLPVTGTGTGAPISHAITATLSAAVVAPAAFSDTVNVTVHY